MADEKELIKLREELKQTQDATRRSRRRAAFGFAILVFALVICMLYSFAQQVAATKNAEEALRQKDLADRARVDAELNAEEARRQEAIAKEQVAAAIMAREMAVQAVLAERLAEERLAKCKGKK